MEKQFGFTNLISKSIITAVCGGGIYFLVLTLTLGHSEQEHTKNQVSASNPLPSVFELITLDKISFE